MQKCFFKKNNTYMIYAGCPEAKALAQRFYRYVWANRNYVSCYGIRQIEGNGRFECVSDMPYYQIFETAKCRYFFGFNNGVVGMSITPLVKESDEERKERYAEASDVCKRFLNGFMTIEELAGRVFDLAKFNLKD